ncbi:MAG TPA: type IV pilus biogenesis/stability protein PilW [Rubrivivax sp.]|nr:type IV pilus biogenesis/stability protein PilW [Rubrivivax sp.]
MRRVAAICALGLALAFGGCTSTVTRTEAKPDAKAVPAAPDPEQVKRGAGVRLELASLYFSRGQYNTALDEIKLAIQADPKNGAAYNLSGLIYAALGNMPQADASFQRALQINAGDADTMNNYGWVLCQNQRYKEAIEMFQRALGQPNYRGAARTLRVMGICQARDGRLDEAEASLVRSYQIDPSSAETAVTLADVQYRRGAYERARFYIDRVNKSPEQSNAQTLWLGARVEYKLGNRALAYGLGEQLRKRYPQAPETLAFEQGRFND